MEIHLNPDLQNKLAHIAARQGSDAESLVREAVEQYVDYDAWFIREVEKGLEDIKRGRVVPHEQVMSEINDIINNKKSKL